MGQACIRPFRGLRSPKATGEREQLIAAENSAASSQITVPYEAEEACGYVNEEGARNISGCEQLVYWVRIRHIGLRAHGTGT